MKEKTPEGILLTATSNTGLKNNSTTIITEEEATLPISPGMNYQLSLFKNNISYPFSQVIGTRHENNLSLIFSNDKSVLLTDYYTPSQNENVNVEIALNNNEFSEQIYFKLPTDSNGINLKDDQQLIIAYGEKTSLLNISYSNELYDLIKDENTQGINLNDILASSDSNNFDQSILNEEKSTYSNASSSFLLFSAFIAAGLHFSRSNKSSNDEKIIDTNIIGSVDAGPVLPGVGLLVIAFDSSGVELSRTVVSDDGKYHINISEPLTDLISLRLIDTNGDLPDYIDEATLLDKDLNADLRSLLHVYNGGDYVANINPVTELIYRSLETDSADPKSPRKVQDIITAEEINEKALLLSTELGLSGVNVFTDTPILSVDNSRNINSSFDSYGQALASISGLEILHQTTTDNILSYILNGTVNDNFSDDVKINIIAGAESSNVSPLGLANNLGYNNQDAFLLVFDIYT